MNSCPFSGSALGIPHGGNEEGGIWQRNEVALRPVILGGKSTQSWKDVLDFLKLKHRSEAFTFPH